MKIFAKIQKETEKAYYIKLQYEHLESNRSHFWETWIPKSVVESIEDGCIGIKDWFLGKKSDEIRSKTGMCRNLGVQGISIFDITFILVWE